MPPPDPWPGTAGGAWSPDWGGNIKLYVWLAIYSGTTFRWGPHAQSRLDAGNVYGGAPVSPAPPANRLWADVTCDVLSLETHTGGRSADADTFIRVEAGTASIVLRDHDRRYDPTNPNSPFQFGGLSRLVPGTGVRIWAEYLAPGASTVTTFEIFSGTVDSWQADWLLKPNQRTATVVATDYVKQLVDADYGPQTAAGAGDTVTQRVNRLLDYAGFTGTRVVPASPRTLQATTFDSNIWDLLQKVAEDEIGAVVVARGVTPTIQLRVREAFTAPPTILRMTVGCAPGVTTFDVVTDVEVSPVQRDFHNVVYAANAGGVTQSALSQSSIDRFGRSVLTKTGLRLNSDSQAAQWATTMLGLGATPRPQVEKVTIKPAFDPLVWPSALNVGLFTNAIRVLWTPPDATSPTDVTGRIAGMAHAVTRHSWDLTYDMVLADLLGSRMHWGAHALDRLNVGNVYV